MCKEMRHHSLRYQISLLLLILNRQIPLNMLHVQGLALAVKSILPRTVRELMINKKMVKTISEPPNSIDTEKFHILCGISYNEKTRSKSIDSPQHFQYETSSDILYLQGFHSLQPRTNPKKVRNLMGRWHTDILKHYALPENLKLIKYLQ